MEVNGRRSRVRRRSHSPLSRRLRQKLQETPHPDPDQTEKRKSVTTIGLSDPGRPLYRSHSWPPPSTSQTLPEKKKNTGTGRRKKLYMFVTCTSPPNDHLLYEVDIPAINYNYGDINAASISEPIIYPIHEFESGKYPIYLSCVQLDSKLYFLGGRLLIYGLDQFSQKVDPIEANWYDMTPRGGRGFEYFPRCVHTFDTVSGEFSSASVPPMHSGKCDPYAFVACGKIYIFGSNPRAKNIFQDDYKLCSFECFDPVTEEWSILPDPISDSFVVGHVVKDDSVYILDGNHIMYRFNLEKCRWYKVDALHNLNRNFVKGAVCIEDKIYAIRCVGSLECLVAYGSVFPSGPWGEAYWDSEVTFESSLLHLESNILCYVSMSYVEEDTNSVENLKNTQESEEDTYYDSPKNYHGSATKFEVKVSVFGVPGKIFAQQTADGLGALFQGERYYNKTIIAGRKCTTDLRDVRMKACFLVDVKE